MRSCAKPSDPNPTAVPYLAPGARGATTARDLIEVGACRSLSRVSLSVRSSGSARPRSHNLPARRRRPGGARAPSTRRPCGSELTRRKTKPVPAPAASACGGGATDPEDILLLTRVTSAALSRAAGRQRAFAPSAHWANTAYAARLAVWDCADNHLHVVVSQK